MKVEAQKLSMEFSEASRSIEVFSELDLTVESGESVAIVGESGVGKTTLLYNLGGLEQPSSGKVFVGDLCITDKSGDELSDFRGQNIGFIFQFHYLLPEFSAQENVEMPLRILGVPERERSERATELLEQVGLQERLQHRPGQLSGGEQQRVAVARALAANPGVILADEFTGNLDLVTGRKIVDMLLELQAKQGQTLIVVTHSTEVARAMSRQLELTPQGFLS